MKFANDSLAMTDEQEEKSAEPTINGWMNEGEDLYL